MVQRSAYQSGRAPRLWSKLYLPPVMMGLLLLTSSSSKAEQETGFRLSTSVVKEFIKELRVFVTPEMRSEGFDPDRYMVEVGLDYRPFKKLEFSPGYRFELRETRIGLTPIQRLRFDSTGKLKWADWEPSLRLRYTGTFRPDRELEHRLRYKAGLDFEPSKRWSFGLGAELFHSLNAQQLERMRYSAGGSYEFYRKKKKDIYQSLFLKYRLDYYLIAPLDAHIFELGYKFKF